MSCRCLAGALLGKSTCRASAGYLQGIGGDLQMSGQILVDAYSRSISVSSEELPGNVTGELINNARNKHGL